MDEAQAFLKGSALRLGRDYLIEKVGGKATFEKLYANAPQVLKEYYVPEILPIKKIPAAAMVAQYDFVLKHFDLETFREGAAKAAFADLNSAMKFFMKIGTPSFVAKKFPNAWAHYFSAGRGVFISSTSNSFEFALEGAEVFGEGGCQGTIGWTREALRYSGAKNVKIEQVECVFHSGSRCHLKYHWD